MVEGSRRLAQRARQYLIKKFDLIRDCRGLGFRQPLLLGNVCGLLRLLLFFSLPGHLPRLPLSFSLLRGKLPLPVRTPALRHASLPVHYGERSVDYRTYKFGT